MGIRILISFFIASFSYYMVLLVFYKKLNLLSEEKIG